MTISTWLTVARAQSVYLTKGVNCCCLSAVSTRSHHQARGLPADFRCLWGLISTILAGYLSWTNSTPGFRFFSICLISRHRPNPRKPGKLNNHLVSLFNLLTAGNPELRLMMPDGKSLLPPF